jgi:hypothetical protein
MLFLQISEGSLQRYETLCLKNIRFSKDWHFLSMTHRSAQFGAMTDWCKYHHIRCLLLSKQQLPPLSVLASASSQTKTPSNATIATTLRLGTILDMTGPAGCNCQPSLSSNNQQTMWSNKLMKRHHPTDCQRHQGRGELKQNFNSKLYPCAQHLVHSPPNSPYWEAFGFKVVSLMLTEEGENRDWQTKNLNVGLVLYSAERQNQDWKSHFQLAFQLQRNKQPVCAIELENSLKSPNPPWGIIQPIAKGVGVAESWTKFQFQTQPLCRSCATSA